MTDPQEAGCQVKESANPPRYCPLPVTHKATKHVDWRLCKDHTILALIAGWEPKPAWSGFEAPMTQEAASRRAAVNVMQDSPAAERMILAYNAGVLGEGDVKTMLDQISTRVRLAERERCAMIVRSCIAACDCQNVAWRESAERHLNEAAAAIRTQGNERACDG